MVRFLSFLFFMFCFSVSVFADEVRFVQVSDVRFSSVDKKPMLSKFVKDVNKLHDVDFVVFTGDNIQKVCIDDLTGFLKEVKKIRKPVYVLIGDKDVNKYKGLSKKEYAYHIKRYLRNYKSGDINYVFVKGGVAFFVVDGAKDVIPGTNGYFKEDTLKWLDTHLNTYSKKNIVILQHFPLIPPAENESYITFKPERYLEILNNHKNVKAVVSGHFGINDEITKDGIVHISTGAFPCYRVIDIVDSETQNPTIWAEVREAE